MYCNWISRKCGLGRLISKVGEEFCLVLFVVVKGGGRREGREVGGAGSSEQ